MLESQCGGWMSGNIQELSDWQPAPRERVPWLANACNSDNNYYELLRSRRGKQAHAILKKTV